MCLSCDWVCYANTQQVRFELDSLFQSNENNNKKCNQASCHVIAGLQTDVWPASEDMHASFSNKSQPVR